MTAYLKNDQIKVKKYFVFQKKKLHLQSRKGRWCLSSVGRAKD